MRPSIIFHLATGFVLVAVATFVVIPRVVHRSLNENLLKEFEDSILAMARGVARLAEYEDGHYEFDIAGEEVAAYGESFAVRTAEGGVIARWGHDIRAPAGRGGWTPFFFDAPSPDGSLRCVSVRARPIMEHAGKHDDEHDEDHEDEHDEEHEAHQGEHDIALAVEEDEAILPHVDIVLGVRRAPVDARMAAVADVVDDSMLLLGFLVLLFVGSSVFFTWRALRGVTRNLETAGLGPIDWRPEPPRELKPLTQALNSALIQAGDAVQRERDVIAGMAHELRTPVAEMLVTTEVALDGGDETAARAALADVRAVALQMKSTVETMLTVARGKAPGDASRIEPVDLGQAWSEVVAGVAMQAAERDVTLPPLPEEHIVRCDPAALRVVLTTIAENAALHAPPGSVVDGRVIVDDEGLRLHIENPAPHLEPGDAARLTEPLWRKDVPESDHHGLGLGLYLASEVAGHAGFVLEPALRDGRLTIHVAIPSARS